MGDLNDLFCRQEAYLAVHIHPSVGVGCRLLSCTVRVGVGRSCHIPVTKQLEERDIVFPSTTCLFYQVETVARTFLGKSCSLVDRADQSNCSSPQRLSLGISLQTNDPIKMTLLSKCGTGEFVRILSFTH
jgi:hypothetical protein